MVKDMDAYHDPWCVKCLYYSRYTKTCDYILIEDHSRPCPAGTGCTARKTRKDTIKMKKPKWDTELGRLLWLEGKTDGEIAEEFGIAISAVTAYRKRHWDKYPIPKEDAAPADDPPVSATPPEEPKEEDAVPESREPTVIRKKSPEAYDILEAATAGMTGIRAICTADAILSLWNWTSREDLERARAAIDHLLKKTED